MGFFIPAIIGSGLAWAGDHYLNHGNALKGGLDAAGDFAKTQYDSVIDGIFGKDSLIGSWLKENEALAAGGGAVAAIGSFFFGKQNPFLAAAALMVAGFVVYNMLKDKPIMDFAKAANPDEQAPATTFERIKNFIFEEQTAEPS